MKEIDKNKIEKEILRINNKYKYTWENEGKKILLDEKKIKITEEEKKILEILLIQEIPNDLRKYLWIICSGSKLLMKENKDNYLKLINSYEQMEKENHYFYKYLTYKISRDLYRSNLKDEEVYKLKNILNAFIIRDLSINYCQGLNLIVSHLLTINNYKEEETFYLFVKLMEDILPFDYYLFAIGIEAEINIINILLKKFEFELYSHLNGLNCICFLESKISIWVSSLMLFKIDVKITNLFFDCLFFLCVNHNNFISILYTIIFSIITILKTDLLKCHNSSDISDIIDNFANNPLSDENYKKLVYYNLISQDKNKFNDKSILELRKKVIEEIIKTKTINYKFEENKKEIICNKKYPLCIKEKEEKPIEKFIIYKSKNPLNIYIIDDFYYGKNEIEENKENQDNILESKINIVNKEKNSKEENISEQKINSDIENLIIERRKHFCE